MKITHNRLPAGILSLSLVISVVIAAIGSSMVIVHWYFGLKTVDYRVENRLTQNLHSGWTLLLSQFTDRTYTHEDLFDLYGDMQDSVGLSKKHWGIYDIGIVRAFHGKNVKQSLAIIGNTCDSVGNLALYLSDEQRPLSLVGNTSIHGKAMIPKSGVKSAYIDRKGYQKDILINGKMSYSRHGMPAVNRDKIAYVASLLANTDPATNSLGYDYHQSFKEPTLVIGSSRSLLLKKCYTGNIKIQSGKQIIVAAKANLKDVLLIAPKIIIQAGFKGSLQAIASDTIIIESKVKLTYPSALVLFNESAGGIQLQAESKVFGTIWIGGLEGKSSNRQLQIAKNASFEGMAYVDGYCQLEGSIYGHLSSRKFVLHTATTLYENHLLDATIDHAQLSPHYLGVADLWGTSDKSNIIQWLQ